MKRKHSAVSMLVTKIWEEMYWSYFFYIGDIVERFLVQILFL